MPMINGRPIGNAFRLCSIISCFSITWCFSTTALSQDQRRRLALFQAWLEAKPIYLFDEWGSDQDPEFNAVITRKSFRRLTLRGKPLSLSPMTIAISTLRTGLSSSNRDVLMNSGGVIDRSPSI